MALCRRPRPGRSLRPLAVASPLAVAVGLLTGVLAPRVALAGKNDLQLLNLCTPTGGECSWVQRDTDGKVTRVAFDPNATSRFRSMMSELGVVVAPRLMTPADTLGFSGFQFSADVGMTKISNRKDFWNGVAGVVPSSPTAVRPDAYLTTIGGYVRKGLWLPIPALEFGAGAMNVVGSSLIALQGYAKLALQEGFQDWPLPSVAVRGSASQLLGTDQVDMTVVGLEVMVSKAFSVAGTARFEPFLAAGYLFIDARSGALDATPACDAYALEHTTGMPSQSCHQTTAGAQDYNANFTFPRQSVITRKRFAAGFKLKLGVLFVTAEYDLIPAGRTRDDMQPTGASVDGSGQQQTFSLAAGLDF
jgi:hypothetical protein